MDSPPAAAQEDGTLGKKPNARIRFIEQFLRQGQQGRLAGLLLGQLDAFNRIATTFGHERCDAFCASYSERLREILPPRTPIIRSPAPTSKTRSCGSRGRSSSSTSGTLIPSS